MAQYRFFRHTPKAVRANSAFTVTPGDRVFVGVRTYADGRVLAWKMTAAPGGVSFSVHHPEDKMTSWVRPQLRTAKTATELAKLIRDAKRGGSEPTAFFKPDSFYRELTEAEVFAS